jgi:hypothetical protein
MFVRLHLWTIIIWFNVYIFNSLISWLVLWSYDACMEYVIWLMSNWNAVKKDLCSNTNRFKILVPAFLQLFRLRHMFMMVSPEMILCNWCYLTQHTLILCNWCYLTQHNFERRTVTDLYLLNIQILCMVFQVWENPFQKVPSPKYAW